MSLHQPIAVDKYSRFSTLVPSPEAGQQTGPHVLPVHPYEGSKWKSAMNHNREPSVVTFNTLGMPEGYGVRHRDLASYSLTIMNTVIAHGSDPVQFPSPVNKIRFRIVWPGYEINFCESIDVQNITVAMLAGKVASVYTKFFEITRKRRCAPGGIELTPELFATLRIRHIQSTPADFYQAEVAYG